MATIPVSQINRFGSSVDPAPAPARLSDAQTGTGASTNVADRGEDRGPGLLQIVSTVGATPTVTVAIQGSMDGTNWYAVPYATAAVPETPSVATFNITTATTTIMHIRNNHAWRFLRLNYSANTNVTLTADLFV